MALAKQRGVRHCNLHREARGTLTAPIRTRRWRIFDVSVTRKTCSLYDRNQFCESPENKNGVKHRNVFLALGLFIACGVVQGDAEAGGGGGAGAVAGGVMNDSAGTTLDDDLMGMVVAIGSGRVSSTVAALATMSAIASATTPATICIVVCVFAHGDSSIIGILAAAGPSETNTCVDGVLLSPGLALLCNLYACRSSRVPRPALLLLAMLGVGRKGRETTGVNTISVGAINIVMTAINVIVIPVTATLIVGIVIIAAPADTATTSNITTQQHTFVAGGDVAISLRVVTSVFIPSSAGMFISVMAMTFNLIHGHPSRAQPFLQTLRMRSWVAVAMINIRGRTDERGGGRGEGRRLRGHQVAGRVNVSDAVVDVAVQPRAGVTMPTGVMGWTKGVTCPAAAGCRSGAAKVPTYSATSASIHAAAVTAMPTGTDAAITDEGDCDAKGRAPLLLPPNAATQVHAAVQDLGVLVPVATQENCHDTQAASAATDTASDCAPSRPADTASGPDKLDEEGAVCVCARDMRGASESQEGDVTTDPIEAERTPSGVVG